jgi:hypothetical protein
VTSSDDVLSSAIVPVGCCESLHTGLSNILRGFAAIVQDLGSETVMQFTRFGQRTLHTAMPVAQTPSAQRG